MRSAPKLWPEDEVWRPICFSKYQTITWELRGHIGASWQAMLTALLPSRHLVSESWELQWRDYIGTGQQSFRVTGIPWASSQDGAGVGEERGRVQGTFGPSLKDSDTQREEIPDWGYQIVHCKQMYRPNRCSRLMCFAEKFLGWNWEVNIKSFIYNSLALWLTSVSEPPLLSCRCEMPPTPYN